ncbi:MAG: MoxR family ATPase [Candidatus Jordarchaeales archaeon]|nr:MoxR family ATPase [Candidatus Jordarchaeia archaeon]
MKSIDEMAREIQSRFKIVGRLEELKKALAAKLASRHLLIEGEVGVGKTTLADAIARYFNQPMFRVDGDERYTEAKLTGWFDPPAVMKYGYTKDAFVPGPLTLAMLEGGILFVNEINRLSESTQNVFLPVMDEGKLGIPKIGEITAKDGFFIIATQNPLEHVGVTALGEALRDRFCWIRIDYQSEEEEREIVALKSGCSNPDIIRLAVKIVRATRTHEDLRRGASVRGAIDIARLLSHYNGTQVTSKDLWVQVAVMALGTRVELEDGVGKTVEEVIREIVDECFEDFR